MFSSLFGLDVFSEGCDFFQTIIALLLHLVPTFIVVIALVIAWRWEWVGAILFVALALFYLRGVEVWWDMTKPPGTRPIRVLLDNYLVWSWGRFPWITYLTISGPLFLVGALFLINWVYRAELRNR